MFLIVCVLLAIFPHQMAEGARYGMDIAMNTVIAGVVPFATVMSAVVYSGLGRVAGAFLSPLFGKLGLSPYGAVAFFSSALGGYPTGASLVGDMYSEGVITKSEAEDILVYANNGGLIFAVGILGEKVFYSACVGWLVWGVQLVCALIAGKILTTPVYHKKMSLKDEIKLYKNKKPPLAVVVGKSIASGGSMAINILSAFIVFYAIMGATGIEKYPFFAGLCEMTGGVMFSGQGGRIHLAALFFCFGGLNVFAQCSAICAKHDLSMKKCILGKAITALLGCTAVYFAESLFKGRYEMAILCIGAVIVCISGIYILKKAHKKVFSILQPPRSPNLGGRKGKLLFHKQICAHSARNFLYDKKSFV